MASFGVAAHAFYGGFGEVFATRILYPYRRPRSASGTSTPELWVGLGTAATPTHALPSAPWSSRTAWPISRSEGRDGFTNGIECLHPRLKRIFASVLTRWVCAVQAGGGIVYDSDPIAEYEETMNKMRANDKALREAEKYFSDLLIQANN